MSAQIRKQKYKDELRVAILDAARELFVDESYEGFSMRKLAVKIKYSPGSIYLYFKNKEELFDCLVEESFVHLLKALEGLLLGEEVDPVIVLRKGMRAYVDFGLSYPNDYRLAFLLQKPVEKRPYTTHAAFEVVRQMVRQCIEKKRFRAVDIETTSQALWAAIHGVTSLLIQRPTFPWVNKDKLVEQVIDNAVNSLLDAKVESLTTEN